MTDETEQAPSLPSYPPPQTGLQVADPRQSKPLYKMMKSLLKPKTRTKTQIRTRTNKPQKWKKQYPFY